MGSKTAPADGGLAFARPADDYGGGSSREDGMTTRTYLAAKAMAAILVTPAGEPRPSPRSVARDAVEYADALLAELAKPAPVATYDDATAEALNGRR